MAPEEDKGLFPKNMLRYSELVSKLATCLTVLPLWKKNKGRAKTIQRMTKCRKMTQTKSQMGSILNSDLRLTHLSVLIKVLKLKESQQ